MKEIGAEREQFPEKELERTHADLAASEEELSAALEDVAVLQGMPEESLEKFFLTRQKFVTPKLKLALRSQLRNMKQNQPNH